MSIPASWSTATLGELGSWTGGGTPSKEVPGYWKGGSVPWVSPKDMKVPRIHVTEDRITVQATLESPAKPVPAGSILVVTRSGILAHTLPVAVLEVDASINQDLKALLPVEGVAPAYVAHALRRFQQEILTGCSKHGTTVQSIEFERLRSFSIPVAPREEQERIIEAIEAQLSRLDDAIASLERVQRNLKRYRAAVLQAAVEGRLVPTEAELARAEGRSFEPASELLARILAERRRRWEEAELAKLRAKGKNPKGDQWKARYVDPVLPVPIDLPRLPAGWCVASLDQLSTRITSGSRDWTRFYGRGNAVFLMAQNVRPGRLDLSFRQRIDPPVGDASRERSQVARGDILATIVGANTGDICRVPESLPEHYVCQSVALIRPVDTLCSQFFEAYLTSPVGQRIFEQFMYGQGRPHLDFDQLKTTPVLLPPLAEQDRIVNEIARAISIAEDGERVGERNLTRCRRLRQSILKWAFEGKLVDQNPSDEPAGVLLERIRAERAEQGSERRPGRRGVRKKKSKSG